MGITFFLCFVVLFTPRQKSNLLTLHKTYKLSFIYNLKFNLTLVTYLLRVITYKMVKHIQPIPNNRNTVIYTEKVRSWQVRINTKMTLTPAAAQVQDAIQQSPAA